MYKLFLKRIIDFFAALCMLTVFSPVIIGITIFLFFANKGKPFFFQPRPGKNEHVFKIIKFKTMNDLKDEEGNFLSEKYRITKVGKFVREHSLDELPQLINVLKGDMSLIGPRPLIVEYLPVYSKTQRKRHNVKPGITGLAQVRGRNSIPWNRKFKYDVFYVKNINFLFDIQIILETIKKVVKKSDLNIEDGLSSEYFNGTN